MAYVAVKGGEDAIEQSLKLLINSNTSSDKISVKQIKENMPLLIDQVMSEAGFYAPEYAALALKQSMGSLEEAVFLLRAYRSTLKRDYYSVPVDTVDMRIERRISASFKDIPGGQILGATFDYSHRMLNFDLMEDVETRVEPTEELNQEQDIYCDRVRTLLQEDGVLEKVQNDDTDPFDITCNLLTFPSPRSARLQTLTRSDSGFLGGIAYSYLRGYGAVHATVGELRSGYVAVEIEHPLIEGECICIGEVCMTEVDALSPVHQEIEGEFDNIEFVGGYGCVFGKNESKAIAMSIVDSSLNDTASDNWIDDEFVLMHGDCMEMSGFISHLKLPHYVTFQSNLDLVRNREGKDDQ